MTHYFSPLLKIFSFRESYRGQAVNAGAQVQLKEPADTAGKGWVRLENHVKKCTAHSGGLVVDAC